MLSKIYQTPLGLLTDLYELTMAHGYWQGGLAEREAVFQLTFRRPPFGGEFAVACGLETVVDWLSALQFGADELRYLASLRGSDDQALFDDEFLAHLGKLQFACDVDAIPEGTLVFAHEPLVRVTGPLLQAQIIETALLNLINFQTLIATNAARICRAADGDPVIDFGLRRAQGIDGGLSASRAAYLGGCAGTSNVLAGKVFDIPVKGTHAHSWVMAFDAEQEAFQAYADAQPNNCIFLVDTYDTLEGVRHAIDVGRSLRAAGHEMLGVRLDSGDLLKLSQLTRAILDAAGFPNAAIVASSELDERIIRDLKEHGAKIDIWGVGTKLVTAYSQPALGGVYKLSALHDGHRWRHKIKLSDDPVKVSTPGQLQVRRFRYDGRFVGDVLWDELSGPPRTRTVTSLDGTDSWNLQGDGEDLLVPVIRRGETVYDLPALHEIKKHTQEQLQQVDPQVLAADRPAAYRVGLEPSLAVLKQDLLATVREGISCD